MRRWNGSGNIMLSKGFVLTTHDISTAVAWIFVVLCSLVGVYDIAVVLFGDKANTITEVIRSNDWLFWAIEVLLVAFFMAHFWRLR